MATPPGPWSWVPPDWLGGADVMPAPEMQFPDDGFSDVTPEALAAARAERDAETEMQFPPDDLALPEHSKPGPTGSARYEFPGWDPFASEAEQAAAFAANNEAAPVATAEQRAAIDAGQDPFAALRSPSPEQPYIGFPTNPDEAPAEATPAALDLPAEPDAITGAGGVPLAPLVPGLGIPEDMFQAAMRGVPMETQGTPELPAEYLTNEEAGIAYAMQSPERQLKQRFDLETRRDEFKREADAKARTADTLRAERIEENLYKSREMSRQKFAQIDAEAKAEAAREIDINRGWANASTGTKIAGIFSAFAGGLVAHKYGGKNSGLEMIDNLISRDIDAQKFSKQQRVNALATRGAAARDRRDMAESDAITDTRMRLAALDRIGAQIQADAQNFDPRGTTAIRYGEMFLDLAAKRAQVARDGEKRIADDYKEQLDLAGKELDLQKKQAELAKAQRAAMGGGGGGSGVSGKLTPDQWAAQYGESARPPGPMDEKTYGRWLTNSGKVAGIDQSRAEASRATRDEQRAEEADVREFGMGGSTRLVTDDAGKPVIDPATGAPKIERGNLLNADGTVWKAGDKGIKDDLAKQAAATEDVVAMIDEVLSIRDRTGGESSTFNSDDSQRLAVLENQILKRIKASTTGMSSDADMDVLRETVGAKDVASFRAKAAGLAKGRERMIASLNRDLRYRGQYTGEPLTFANPYTKSTAVTKDESERKTLFKAPEISIDEADRQAAVIVRKRLGDDFKNPQNARAVSDEISGLAADYKEISPDQKIAIGRLGDLAGGTGPKAGQAEKDLSDIAANGHTEKIRAAAQNALMSAARTKGGI